MTKEQAIKLLSNETFISEIAKIEYYAGFNSEEVYKAYNEACDEAVESMEKDVEKKIHQNNPVCAWCFRNTAIKHDSRGWVMPEKIAGYAGNKIDGTMSKIIAYATLRDCKTAFLAKLER